MSHLRLLKADSTPKNENAVADEAVKVISHASWSFRNLLGLAVCGLRDQTWTLCQHRHDIWSQLSRNKLVKHFVLFAHFLFCIFHWNSRMDGERREEIRERQSFCTNSICLLLSCNSSGENSLLYPFNLWNADAFLP